MKRLQDKAVIITGAGSGIGRASAQLFADHGARLVLTDIQAPGLQGTAELLAQHGHGVVALAGDAADPEHVRALVQQCIDRYGACDAYFANAGICGAPAPLLEESLDTWHETLRVNLLGPVVAIQAAAPSMAARGKGSIILTASVAGIRSGAGPSSYSASKAGVISLAQTAACQLATQGIRVNAICPGLIQTGMTQPIFEMAEAAGRSHRLGKHCPMQRPAQPQEVANLALFLASDEASYVTGQAFAVDGGITSTHPFTPGRVI